MGELELVHVNCSETSSKTNKNARPALNCSCNMPAAPLKRFRRAWHCRATDGSLLVRPVSSCPETATVEGFSKTSPPYRWIKEMYSYSIILARPIFGSNARSSLASSAYNVLDVPSFESASIDDVRGFGPDHAQLHLANSGSWCLLELLMALGCDGHRVVDDQTGWSGARHFLTM